MKKLAAGAETPGTETQPESETPIAVVPAAPSMPNRGGAFVRLADGTLEPEAPATDKEA